MSGRGAGDAKVLYIVGPRRSGSTLLTRVLGTIPGFFAAGELRYLWDHLLEGRRCGCGAPIAACPMWSAVVGEGRPMGHPDVCRLLVSFQDANLRIRHTWRLLGAPPPPGSAVDAYASWLELLHRRIARAAGAGVVVDSTKRPSDGAALLRTDLDAYFLHLVRDPRAVAFSWDRQKREVDPTKPDEMDRLGPLRSGLEWTWWNLGTERLRRAVPPERWLRLRYEDFVASPEGSVARILTLVGEPAPRRPVVDGEAVRLGSQHTVAGNPDRFTTGTVRIRLDDEWRRRQSAMGRLEASAAALPLGVAYGYLRGSRREDAG